MIEFVYGKDEEVSRFVAGLIPHAQGRGFGRCKTIGVTESKQLIGGLVYSNWNPVAGHIEITGAATSPRWFTPETIRRMYQYPFIEVGCQMVVQTTPADDERLLGQLARGGYMFVRVPRMFGRDRDGVLCLLTVEDWIKHPITQRYRHHIVSEPEQRAA